MIQLIGYDNQFILYNLIQITIKQIRTSILYTRFNIIHLNLFCIIQKVSRSLANPLSNTVANCSFISSGHRNIRCFSCCSVTVHRNIRCLPFSITKQRFYVQHIFLFCFGYLGFTSLFCERFLCNQIGNSLSLHNLRRS